MPAVINAVESARTFNWKDSVAQLPELDASIDPESIYKVNARLALGDDVNFYEELKAHLAEYYPEIDSQFVESLDTDASNIIVSKEEIAEVNEIARIAEGSGQFDRAMLEPEMIDENGISKKPLMVLAVIVAVVFYAVVTVKVKTSGMV